MDTDFNISKIAKNLNISYTTAKKYINEYKKHKSDLDIETFITEKIEESKSKSLKNLMNYPKVFKQLKTYENIIWILVIIASIEFLIIIYLI